jgi:hypothetical protein
MGASDPLDDADGEAGDLPPGVPGGTGPPGAAGPGGTGTVGMLADVVRRAVLTGVGALFLTEEGARKIAREWKLPKELAGYLVQQAQGAKDEMLRVVGQEMRRFFESEAFRRELARFLGSMVVEVNARVRLSEAGPAARARTTVKVRRKGGARRPRPARRPPAAPPGGGEGAGG